MPWGLGCCAAQAQLLPLAAAADPWLDALAARARLGSHEAAAAAVTAAAAAALLVGVAALRACCGGGSGARGWRTRRCATGH